MPGDKWRDAMGFMASLRSVVLRWCGMPVSIGAGPTKTLAKAANRIAKSRDTGGVFAIDSEKRRIEALAGMPVGELWGIGRRLARRLHAQGIETALELSRQPLVNVRKDMGLATMCLIRELRGEPSVGMSPCQARKTIVHSRTFPRRTNDLGLLVKVARIFASRVAERARRIGFRARVVGIHLTTGKHTKGKCHDESRVGVVEPPSNDSWDLMGLSESLVREIHRPGCQYNRLGVSMLELSDARQGDIDLGIAEPKGSDGLMAQIDRLNSRYGRNSVRFGDLSWKQNQEHMSPNYVSGRSTLPLAR